MISIQTEPKLQQFFMTGIRSKLDDPEQGLIACQLYHESSPIKRRMTSDGTQHSWRRNPFINIILSFSPKEVKSLEQTRYYEILELDLSFVCAERNRLLHATSIRGEFQTWWTSGLAILEFYITMELEWGLRNLPMSLIQIMFELNHKIFRQWWFIVLAHTYVLASEAPMDALIDNFSE